MAKLSTDTIQTIQKSWGWDETDTETQTNTKILTVGKSQDRKVGRRKPNISETDSETFCAPSLFRDRFRDTFQYQFFSNTGPNTINKNEKVPKTGIPGTGTSHSAE